MKGHYENKVLTDYAYRGRGKNLHKTVSAHQTERKNRDTLPQLTFIFFAPLLAVVLVSGYPIGLARDTSSQLETGTTVEEIYPTWLQCECDITEN